MSVRVGDRVEGRLTVIDATRILLKYTHDKVKDNEIFPKADRWLMAKDVWESVSQAYTKIIRANAIRVETKSEAEERLKLSKEALGHIEAFMALIDMCYVLGKISDNQMKYWAGLGDDVLKPLKKWIKSERSRYKTFCN